jgi:hypothetical protein
MRDDGRLEDTVFAYGVGKLVQFPCAYLLARLARVGGDNGGGDFYQSFGRWTMDDGRRMNIWGVVGRVFSRRGLWLLGGVEVLGDEGAETATEATFRLGHGSDLRVDDRRRTTDDRQWAMDNLRSSNDRQQQGRLRRPSSVVRRPPGMDANQG